MDACRVIMILLVSLFLTAVPSVLARKCYQCDSLQNQGCADANQISQLYTDCSSGGGYGASGGFGAQGGFQGGMQPGGGGFGGQPGFPQTMGQVGQPGIGGGSYGSYGSMDRCIKVTTVGVQMGGSMNGQPRVQRLCGAANGMSQDGCVWQGSQQVCTCNWNYCNGSSRLSTGSLSAIGVAAVATVLSYLYRSSL